MTYAQRLQKQFFRSPTQLGLLIQKGLLLDLISDGQPQQVDVKSHNQSILEPSASSWPWTVTEGDICGLACL